jgi:pectate lyase
VLPLRVGNDVATINDVMGVIEILSSRREYTKIYPFVVLLGKGDHQITSSWTSENGAEVETTLDITCSNISFAGTGKDTTTILGGFRIDNHENITFKNMTVTNTSENGFGIHVRNAKVELVDFAFKECCKNDV